MNDRDIARLSECTGVSELTVRNILYLDILDVKKSMKIVIKADFAAMKIKKGVTVKQILNDLAKAYGLPSNKIKKIIYEK